jgi:hypothetical protein
MLKITLEPKDHVNKISPNQNENLNFELKAVTEVLFPEVRLSFVSDNSKRRSKENPPKNILTQKAIYPDN